MKSLLTILTIVWGFYLSGYSQALSNLNTVDKILVSDKIKLEIERSDTYSLEIKSPNLTEDCVVKIVENGMLTLKLMGTVNCRGEVNAVLRLPTLTYIEVIGGAEVYTRNVFKNDSMQVRIKSNSEVRISIDVKYLSVHAVESALLVVDGYAIKQDLVLGTKASYSAYNLESQKTKVSASLGSIAKVNVDEELKASAKSNAFISYKGKPAKKNFEEKLGGRIEASDED